MRNWAALTFLMMLAGCASAPVEQRAVSPFHDQLFAAPSERISADDVFALSDQMKRYLSTDITPGLRAKGTQQGLYDTLYGHGQLKLDYDSATTRNASQAFAARSGNCLSLVILTAAIAKELGLTVRYQVVYVDEAWSRSDDIQFFDEHVNITLGIKQAVGRIGHIDGNEMTVDFLPPANLGRLRTRVIGEETIVARYMNNRAAESITEQQVDRAYWWARAAISQDPRYLPAYNTLGVIYKLHGNMKEAEQVFTQILGTEPENTIAMSNLVLVLNALGRTTEANSFAEMLKKIRPYPPFHYFDLGMEAMKQGDFDAAKTMFAKEVQRNAYYDQAHFWLALAYYNLGDLKNARKQMGIAVETSTTRSGHDLYAAKLAWLRSAHHP